MADRFDNLSLSQLQAADVEALLEHERVEAATKKRMIRECKIKEGEVVRIVSGKHRKRLLKVIGIRAERGYDMRHPEKLSLIIEGRFYIGRKKGFTPTGDGFGRRSHWVDPKDIEP